MRRAPQKAEKPQPQEILRRRKRNEQEYADYHLTCIGRRQVNAMYATVPAPTGSFQLPQFCTSPSRVSWHDADNWKLTDPRADSPGPADYNTSGFMKLSGRGVSPITSARFMDDPTPAMWRRQAAAEGIADVVEQLSLSRVLKPKRGAVYMMSEVSSPRPLALPRPHCHLLQVADVDRLVKQCTPKAHSRYMDWSEPVLSNARDPRHWLQQAKQATKRPHVRPLSAACGSTEKRVASGISYSFGRPPRHRPQTQSSIDEDSIPLPTGAGGKVHKQALRKFLLGTLD